MNLTALGVLFGSPLIAENPNPLGTGHQQWLKLPWAALPREPRTFPDAPTLRISEAVLKRINGGPVLANNLVGTQVSLLAREYLDLPKRPGRIGGRHC